MRLCIFCIIKTWCCNYNTTVVYLSKDLLQREVLIMGELKKTYTVSEAIEFLREEHGRYAPKSEETLRRAIRSGKLKAEVRRGREGSVIDEPDLRAYGKAYALKAKVLGDTAAAAKSVRKETKDQPKKYVEFMTEAIRSGRTNDWGFRLSMITERDKWARKEAELKERLQSLQSEADMCRQEKELFDKEIMKK